MQYHILNGDALKETFPSDQITGKVIVIREAFIEGPVSDSYDPSYWSSRKNYIEKAYGEPGTNYDEKVLSEFNRLQRISDSDEVYLWFEDDLFCQCNMWFSVNYILQYSRPDFFRVFPAADTVSWIGFGKADQDTLFQYYKPAIRLSPSDVDHIDQLWKSFVAHDQKKLKALSEVDCNGIRFQKEVIQALLDKTPDVTGWGRPQKTLAVLLKEDHSSFYQLFEKFAQREGIYGFGDSQVRNMLKEMNINL